VLTIPERHGQKCHRIVLYIVHFTAFCLGGPFFPGHGVLKNTNQSNHDSRNHRRTYIERTNAYGFQRFMPNTAMKARCLFINTPDVTS